MSYYVHNVPGRLRLKNAGIRRNQAAADEIKKTLSVLHGIATVDINLVTGSILINYQPKMIKHQDIISALQRKGYFDADKAITNEEYIHKAATKAGSIVGRAFFGTMVEKALEGSALSLLTLLI